MSLKYLGSRTSEKVKNKILELLYSWTVGLPEEVKISEAYQMLKKQGEPPPVGWQGPVTCPACSSGSSSLRVLCQQGHGSLLSVSRTHSQWDLSVTVPKASLGEKRKVVWGQAYLQRVATKHRCPGPGTGLSWQNACLTCMSSGFVPKSEYSRYGGDT